MRIPPNIVQEAIERAHNRQQPIRVIAGSIRSDTAPYDVRGLWTATIALWPWWYPGPYVLVATVTETATGVEIVSEL